MLQILAKVATQRLTPHFRILSITTIKSFRHDYHPAAIRQY